MKHQTCITLDLETHRRIREKLRDHHYRSKSHLIECAVLKFLKEDEHGS